MAIATRADLANAMAGGQQIFYGRNTSSGAQLVTAGWASLFNVAGPQGAGTMAGTSTAAGVVPDDTTTGCPSLNGFGAGNTGYLGAVTITPTPTTGTQNSLRFRLCDMLFKAGAYAFNAAVTLAAQPSYSSRIPNGDYKGTEIWWECVTTHTGVPTITVTYTNEAGVAGRATTITISGGTSGDGRHVQFPLAAGDTGVQKIESVTCTVATAGTFNILVLRPLWCGHVVAFGDVGASGDLVHGPDLTGLPVLFSTSALVLQSMNCLGNTMNPHDAIFAIIQG